MASALDRPRSRSSCKLGTPQAAEAGHSVSNIEAGTMRGLIAMGLISVLFGCSDGRSEETSSDDVSRAALTIVWPLPECNKSWSGGTMSQCDVAQKRLDDRREEFKSFEPAWMRKAIEHWFDYAQRNINEAREDCRTNKSRAELDAYDRRRKAEAERTRMVLKSIGR